MPLVEVSNRTAVWHMTKGQLLEFLISRKIAYDQKETKEELRVRALEHFPKSKGPEKEKDIMSQYLHMNKSQLVQAATGLKVVVNSSMLKGAILNAIRVHLTGATPTTVKQESTAKEEQSETRNEGGSSSSMSSSANGPEEDRENMMQTGLAGRRRHP